MERPRRLQSKVYQMIVSHGDLMEGKMSIYGYTRLKYEIFLHDDTTSIPPLFATGLGALELLGWRKKKAALAACRTN